MSQSAVTTLKLGEILVREGYLTMDAVNKVLKIQQEKGFISESKKNYKPFGQICVELNLISSEELQRVLRKHNKRIQLGELLVNQGLIKPQHVDWAVDQQRVRSQRLGEILISNGLINSSQLLDALSIQLDVPRMMPAMDLIDEKLMGMMPMKFFREHLCVPLYLSGRQLTVVMDNPGDEGVIKLLESAYKCKVQPAIATPADIDQTLNDYEKYVLLPILGPLGDEPEAAASAASAPAAAPAAPASEEPWIDSTAPKPIPVVEPAAAAQPAAQPAAAAPPAQRSQTVSVGGASLQTGSGQRTQEDQVVSFLIKNALKDRATDIHIEPQEKHVRIRYRIDGILHHKTDLPTHLGPPMLTRLKELCRLNPALAEHQRGQVESHFNGQDLELRVATYPSLWGENMVLQIQEKESTNREFLLNLDRIGFSPLYLLRYQNILTQPGGLIILTGPARSGKTATLYASINYLNQQNRSIVTAENPVEMPVPGTIQGGWKSDSGKSFADMIHSMLHLDPDILMVSEIEDATTLEAVVEVALTGAKVITSYPAFDATGALLRLNRMGLENFLIAASNITVLSQRLVRRLCDQCRQPHTPSQDTFNRLGLVDVSPESFTFYKPGGCEACGQHGYRGQIAIHELLQINEAIREAILDHKPAATIRGIARTEAKLVSMAEDGLFKAIEGLTSLEEIQRVAFVNEYDSQTPWQAEEIFRICKGLEAEFI
ncbi:MAG: GspE/PulE family protein [Candidatus Sericytochromatia bacterium]